MKRFNRTMFVSFLVVLSMVFSVSAVFADGGTIVLTGGDTEFISASSFTFGPATLAGGNFSSTDLAGTDAKWSMVDARGTGAGWSVTVSVSSMTGLTQTLTLADTMAPAYNEFGMKVTLADSDVEFMDGAGGSTPTDEIAKDAASGVSVPETGVSSLTVLLAAEGEGMGGYDIDPLFTLYMPAGIYAGTGSLTVTVTKTDGVL